MKVDNLQIDEPLVITDIVNAVINTDGVISLTEMPKIFSRSGLIDGRHYNTGRFDVASNTRKGLVVPPPGGIFELKFMEFDIIGNAS